MLNEHGCGAQLIPGPAVPFGSLGLFWDSLFMEHECTVELQRMQLYSLIEIEPTPPGFGSSPWD